MIDLRKMLPSPFDILERIGRYKESASKFNVQEQWMLVGAQKLKRKLLGGGASADMSLDDFVKILASFEAISAEDKRDEVGQAFDGTMFRYDCKTGWNKHGDNRRDWTRWTEWDYLVFKLVYNGSRESGLRVTTKHADTRFYASDDI